MGGEVGDGGGRIILQGPATDFCIEGGILDVERDLDVRHEMGEVFVEDVGEKADLGSLSAFDSFMKESTDGFSGYVYISSAVALRAIVPGFTSGR